MSSKLQIGLIIFSITTLIFVVRNVVKNKMNIRYSLIWILWTLIIIVMAIVPKLIYLITSFIGIEKPVNTVFLIMIFLLYLLSYYLFLTISKQKEDIANLNYEIAKLKKQMEEKK